MKVLLFASFLCFVAFSVAKQPLHDEDLIQSEADDVEDKDFVDDNMADRQALEAIISAAADSASNDVMADDGIPEDDFELELQKALLDHDDLVDNKHTDRKLAHHYDIPMMADDRDLLGTLISSGIGLATSLASKIRWSRRRRRAAVARRRYVARQPRNVARRRYVAPKRSYTPQRYFAPQRYFPPQRPFTPQQYFNPYRMRGYGGNGRGNCYDE